MTSALVRFTPPTEMLSFVDLVFSDPSLTDVECEKRLALPRGTVDGWLRSPPASAWLAEDGVRHCHAALPRVYAVLLDRALKSTKSTWMELFLKRFDPDFSKALAASAPPAVHQQILAVLSMTEDELKNFIGVKQRQILGSAS